MKKAIFITARLGSSRLFQKHLLKIIDKHCIEYVFENAKKSKFVNEIVLCTTTLEEDNILCELAQKYNIKVFRGSVEDKMDRWLKACEQYKIDVLVCYDADDVLASVDLMDAAFEQQERNNTDIIDWELNGDLICGCFTYCVKAVLLERYCNTKTSNNTEMSSKLLKNLPGVKSEKLYNVPKIFCRPEIRATLDYIEDYQFFVAIFDNFYQLGKKTFDLKDVVKFLDENPDIIKINQFRHEDWEKNQKRLSDINNL